MVVQGHHHELAARRMRASRVTVVSVPPRRSRNATESRPARERIARCRRACPVGSLPARRVPVLGPWGLGLQGYRRPPHRPKWACSLPTNNGCGATCANARFLSGRVTHSRLPLYRPRWARPPAG